MSATFCPSCLSRQYEAGRCGKCGFAAAEYKPARTALPLGSTVGGYRLGVMKSNSRQSQIYTAVHTETSAPAVIEEFFPAKVAGRSPNSDEVVLSSSETEFVQRFQQGCLLLEASGQKRPLKRTAVIHANNTVYSVFEPAATVSLAAQCEMMADNPYYFRDQDGKPMMTINVLPIPPMPQERKYNGAQVLDKAPITQPSGEGDLLPETLITEAAKPQKKRKILLIAGIILSVLVLAGVALLIVQQNRRREEEKLAELQKQQMLQSTMQSFARQESAMNKAVLEEINRIVEENKKEEITPTPMPEETEVPEALSQANDLVGGSGTAPTPQPAESNEEEHQETDASSVGSGLAPEASVESSEEESDKPDQPVELETPPIEQPETLSKEEFLKYLKVYPRDGQNTIQGRKLKDNAKDFQDDTGKKGKEELTAPVDVIELDGKIIQFREEDQDICVIVHNNEKRYRVIIGRRNVIKTGEGWSSQYFENETGDGVLTITLWKDEGDFKAGEVMAFARDGEEDKYAMNMIVDYFNDGWKKENVQISVTASEGGLNLCFGQGKNSISLPIRPMEPKDADVREIETAEPKEAETAEPEVDTSSQSEAPSEPEATPKLTPEELEDASRGGVYNSESLKDLREIRSWPKEGETQIEAEIRTTGRVKGIIVTCGEKTIQFEHGKAAGQWEKKWTATLNYYSGAYHIIYTLEDDTEKEEDYIPDSQKT